MKLWIGLFLLAAISVARSDDQKVDLDPVVERLSDERFIERQKAAAELIKEAGSRFDEVVLALYSEKVQSDPERRLLATSVMRKVYQRQVLGRGAPYCGWRLERLITDDKDGRMVFSPLVGDVEPDSPAGRAGLGEGDEILTYNGAPLPPAGGVTLLQRRVANSQPGDEVTLTVRRWHPKFEAQKRSLKKQPGEVRTLVVVLGQPLKKPTRAFSEESFGAWVALEVDAVQRSSRPASH